MDERGFTLIELLVVILVIGILASIALPAFLGHADRARDAKSKADVRNAVSQMESCYRAADLYTGCPDALSPLAAGVVAMVSPLGDGYSVTTVSATGTRFTIVRLPNDFARFCDRPGEAGCRSDSGW